MGGFQQLGVPSWGPNNKGCHDVGSILGRPQCLWRSSGSRVEVVGFELTVWFWG